MNAPVALHFVTYAQERCELHTEGFAQTDGDGVKLRFAGDDYRMRIRISGDTAVIEREGENGYTMTLRKGHTYPLGIGPFVTRVHTKQWLFKHSEKRIDFTAQYALGDSRTPVKIILHAVYLPLTDKNPEET